ncbi:hypothetical protein LMB49_10660 [Limosilactobacillus reuteri]|uniref:hypothetical protein n=1 Tax=Limosilactobacillus reuteri TaxID=1598 RepID=UPI001E4B9738|nr:hypothetical protein [Limosilactobacillus reuteri]MCC4370578.1 hypothetical protein [Limosilactobacillus reuteri]MCC4371853.1 hypothetical protein [Limosilactobacillus reuteri]MCC4509325.1 hypothetical protein [Limosilactobacillus reuteri]MCC4509368.1 hypothetical protein [Limosilactobacillus reuteri]
MTSSIYIVGCIGAMLFFAVAIVGGGVECLHRRRFNLENFSVGMAITFFIETIIMLILIIIAFVILLVCIAVTVPDWINSKHNINNIGIFLLGMAAVWFSKLALVEMLKFCND